MDLAIPLVLGALAVIVVTAFAPRLGIAAPLILVVVGVAVSFLPFVSAVELEPELILGGVLPPLLYSSAVSMPTMDFRRDFKLIGGLSVILVVVTAVVIGWVLYLVVPDINLPMGIALGAIISPTDAVATSIVKRLGVSPRVVTILEGESLLNDASALVVLRSAVAAMAGAVSLGHVAWDFVYAVVVAVAVGFVVGRVSLMLRARIKDAVLNTAASFVVPFVAYLPAEHLGASGLVAVVVTGLVMGQGSPRYLRPQDRRAEESNWRTVELLLEGAVFLLMGLELFGLVTEVHEEHQSAMKAVVIAAIAFVGVLVVRTGFLVPFLFLLRRDRREMKQQRAALAKAQERLDAQGAPGSGPGPDAAGPGERREVPLTNLSGKTLSERQQRRFKRRLEKGRARIEGRMEGMDEAQRAEQQEQRKSRIQNFLDRRVADIDYLTGEPLGSKQGVVLVWAGMRGVVTLAAAQTLPETVTGNDSYHRALLVLIAFIVAAGSLFLQGGTLGWVVRRLGLSGDDGSSARVERQELVAELAGTAAEECARDDLVRADGSPYDPGVVELVRKESVRIVDENGFDLVPGTESTRYDEYRELRIRVIQAQRDELLRIRDVGTYSADALGDVLEVLDADEIGLELRGSHDEDDTSMRPLE
ncbi:cation:proton antiporter [Luteimicrobium sp. NPDC057192]|uniref:cation:proton antiporter n=1 Tax=Luteimicrobium sp. NPDC057192 TaxID=3346042 RepID=UPI003634EE81